MYIRRWKQNAAAWSICRFSAGSGDERCRVLRGVFPQAQKKQKKEEQDQQSQDQVGTGAGEAVVREEGFIRIHCGTFRIRNGGFRRGLRLIGFIADMIAEGESGGRPVQIGAEGMSDAFVLQGFPEQEHFTRGVGIDLERGKTVRRNAADHPEKIRAMRPACLREARKYTPEAAMRQILRKMQEM